MYSDRAIASTVLVGAISRVAFGFACLCAPVFFVGWVLGMWVAFVFAYRVEVLEAGIAFAIAILSALACGLMILLADWVRGLFRPAAEDLIRGVRR